MKKHRKHCFFESKTKDNQNYENAQNRISEDDADDDNWTKNQVHERKKNEK